MGEEGLDSAPSPESLKIEALTSRLAGSWAGLGQGCSAQALPFGSVGCTSSCHLAGKVLKGAPGRVVR